ncbi:EpsG family protein [Sporomusa termitida]|uniref:EpsG family protein n=1 Tax=Sporomusa termitida TaxID=2377 RepID=A0A517DXC4_9FIRM|nr:EpsG family protein [Sporomusa termitida]QDR82015.1 EpsG family protein [Sporomusa termitida]
MDKVNHSRLKTPKFFKSEVSSILLFLILAISFTFLVFEFIGISRFASKVLSAFPLLLLFITVAFNRSYTLDYYDYKNSFDTGYDSELFDIGFSYLAEFLKFMGLEFESILFIIGVLLIFVILMFTKSSRYTNLVVILYSIGLLIINVTQLRNTIMYLIVFISLIFIQKRKVIKHYLLMFIAISMHKFALIYTPFYYLCTKPRKEFISLVWKGVLIASIVAPIVMNILVWLFPQKLTVYLEREPGLGILIVFVYVLFDLFTIWWIDRKTNNKIDKKDQEMVEVLYRFVFFSIISIPFTFYFLEVKRMQRNALLAKFFYSAMTLQYMNQIDKLITIVLLLISALLPLLVMYYNDELSKFIILDRNVILDFIGVLNFI